MGGRFASGSATRGPRDGGGALEHLDELRAALTEQSVADLILRRLHEFLDWAQRQLILVQQEIAGAFWQKTASMNQSATQAQ